MNNSTSCASGSFITWDATAQTFGCAAPAALISSGVAAGAYGSATQIPVVTIGSDGRVTAASNVALGASGATGAASGDLSGTYPAPTVQALRRTALLVTSLANDQFLKYNGTNWINAAITQSDVSGLSTALATYMTTSQFNANASTGSCSTSQTLYWNSVSGSFACQSIAIAGTQITGPFSGNLSGNVTGNLTGNVTGSSSLNVLKAGACPEIYHSLQVKVLLTETADQTQFY